MFISDEFCEVGLCFVNLIRWNNGLVWCFLRVFVLSRSGLEFLMFSGEWF